MSDELDAAVQGNPDLNSSCICWQHCVNKGDNDNLSKTEKWDFSELFK